MEILRCNICGKILFVLKKGVVDTICCGNKMEHLVPNSVGTLEKHMPEIINRDGNVVVSVDSHPYEENHHIEWIAIETDKGCHFKMLENPYMPLATFELSNEKLISAYVYCNLHGLWMKEF